MTVDNVSNSSGEQSVTDLQRIVGVYSITCKKNGMVYVGSSENVYRRLLEHLDELRNGTHANSELLADFKLHGESAFELLILERHESRSAALNAEARLIKQARKDGPSYNISLGGKYRPRKSSKDYSVLLRSEKNVDPSYSLQVWMKRNGKSISDLIEECGFERMRSYRLAAGAIPNPEEMRSIYTWTAGEVDANAIYGLNNLKRSVAA